MEVGTKFGKLEVLALRQGAKNVHPIAICRCDCGQMRKVRQTSLRLGKIKQCAQCVNRWETRRRPAAEEVDLRDRESIYKCNAKRKDIAWGLSRQQCHALLLSPCRYCGAAPARGIDRLNNLQGYVTDNSVPCCATCNYAKREMSADDFLSWVGRVFRHAFQ